MLRIAVACGIGLWGGGWGGGGSSANPIKNVSCSFFFQCTSTLNGNYCGLLFSFGRRQWCMDKAGFLPVAEKIFFSS